MFEEKKTDPKIQSFNVQDNYNSSVDDNVPKPGFQEEDFLSDKNSKQLKKRKKLGPIFLFLFIFLLIAGAFVFWYYKGEAMYFTYKMSLPWGDTIKNYQNTSKIIIEFKQNNNSQENFLNLIFGGGSKIDATIDSKVVNKDSESSIKASYGNFAIPEVVVKYLDDSGVYFKLNITGILSFLMPMDSDSSESISDKWIYYPKTGISSDYDQDFYSKINEYFNNFFTKKDNVSEIKELKDFFEIIDPHENKKENSISSKKFNIKIKEGKSINLAMYILKNYDENTYKEFLKKYEDYKNGKNPDFEKTIKQFDYLNNKLNFSIWVNKKTASINEIEFSLENLNMDEDFQETDVPVSISFNSKFSELKDYKIEKPQEQDITSLEEMMKSFNYMNTIPTIETEEYTKLQDRDNDGLLDMYEAVYNTDLEKEDTDGDTYSDGEEVIRGYNPNGSGKLEDDKNIFYFAYGPSILFENMQGLYGDKNFVSFKKAVLDDYEFYFYQNNSSNIKESKGTKVYGVLYKINKDVLSLMDQSSLSLYNKTTLKVKNNFGDFDAIVYIAKDTKTTSVPDDYYLERIISGAQQSDFPIEYISSIELMDGITTKTQGINLNDFNVDDL